MLESDIEKLYSLSEEELSQVIAHAHTALDKIKRKVVPFFRSTTTCNCICHKSEGVRHMMPCCSRTYEQF